MSDLRALREVEDIRVRRVDDAEDALRLAQQAQKKAEQALEEARQALADYKGKLPGLIEQLYADCIGHLVSREFVQDKVYDETRLRAKVEDYKAQVVEAQNAHEKAIQAAIDALVLLNRERVKLDAIRELIKAERKQIAIAVARTEAKALDDLAGSKFVRAMMH
jgi:flagellar biosynthesis chaperone FliJ